MASLQLRANSDQSFHSVKDFSKLLEGKNFYPGPLRPSTYIALFFKQLPHLWEQANLLIGQHQQWLYIGDEHDRYQVRQGLSAESLEKPGEFLASSQIFLREQVIRAKPVVEALRTKIQTLKTDRLVVFLEMSWAVRTPSGDIYLRDVHAALQDLLTQQPFTLVCIYNESVLLEEQLLMGLFSHPFVFAQSVSKANPYYLPPSILKKNQLRPRFEYWLANVDEDRSSPTLPVVGEDNTSYVFDRSTHTQIAQSDEGRWKIRCLGELRIYRENGALVQWNTKAGATKKLKTLFAFLLIRGERGASAEELADLLWPESDDLEQGVNRLYHVVRYLRMVLGGDDQDTRHSAFLVNQGANYHLKLPYDSWIDLPMFQELCYKGNHHLQAGQLEQCKICYESADRLYTGDLFADLPAKYVEMGENDWCWGKRIWYREMHFKLLYSLAKVNRQLGDPTAAIAYCDRALAESPVLEEAHQEKLLALADSKRYDALHRQYRIYADSLKKFNLGTPSETVRNLYKSLVNFKT